MCIALPAFEQGSSHKVLGSEASCASDKPVRYRLCRLLVHALRRLRSVQFTFTPSPPFSFLAKLFPLPRGFLSVPWWNSLGLVLCAGCFSFVFLSFFVFENLLLLPRVFGGPLVEFPLCGFVCSGFSSLTFLLLPGFLEVPWWNSLCLVLCARFFVLENLLLLPLFFGGPLVEFPLCGSCPPHRGFVCV